MCRFGAFLRVQRKWSPPATELIRAVDVSGGRNTFANALSGLTKPLPAYRSHWRQIGHRERRWATMSATPMTGVINAQKNDKFSHDRTCASRRFASYLAIGTAMM
jgi:hypothetical protein